MTDTSPDVERVMIASYRRMSPLRKFACLQEGNRSAWYLHRAGCLQRNPEFNEKDIQTEWAEITLGPCFPSSAKERWRMQPSPPESLALTREVMSLFGKLGIPCALGGSFASTLHGVPRQTLDADLMVEPFLGREGKLINALGPDYYVSLAAVQDANRNRASFNLIHTPSAFKVDVFVHKGRPFDESVMRRKVRSPLADDTSTPVDVVSAEDIILLKLEWYRLGGEISDRQWGDILGVLKVRGDSLDDAYLDQWAADLGVGDLLARVRAEAASPGES